MNAPVPIAGDRPSPPTRALVTVWAVALALVLALASAAGVLLAQVRQNSLDDAQEQVLRFTSGAQAAINRSLLGVDVLLASTGEIAQLGTSSDLHGASASLRSAAKANLLVRTVALLDKNGRTLASSAPQGGAWAAALPEGFLQAVTAEALPRLTISTPTTNPQSAERVFYLARTLWAADGQQRLAVAEVALSQLSPILLQSVDIAGLRITLEHSDGRLLLALPPSATAPASPQPPSPGPTLHRKAQVQWQEMAQGAAQGSEPVLAVIQPTIYADLWLTAHLPQSAALAPSRSEIQGIASITALLCLLMLGIAALAHRYVQRMFGIRQAMAEAKNTLDQALQSMISGFLLLGADKRVLQWNRRYLELFPWLQTHVEVGVPFVELLTLTVENHLPHGAAQERHQWVQWRLEQLGKPEGTSFEQRLPSGQYVQITERPTPDGMLVITYHDVTELRHANQEIETLAFYDALTGLPNRRLLLDRLGLAIHQTQRSGQKGALLFADLDKFKLLNDTRGHEVGDQLLQLVAKRLQQSVRNGDTVARLGGDEFVILLGDLNHSAEIAAAQARLIGEKLLEHLAQPYDLAGQQYRSSCSVGATVFGQEMISAIELLQRADIAMYQVKKSNQGNTLCFFDPQMQEAISERVRLEADLQTALQDGQFELFYQPQFTLSGPMIGAEALLRWRHPLRGMIAPGQFIEVAEDSGLIVPIGLWVLQQACTQLAAWRQDRRCAGLQLSVNVSARQFRQADFAQQVIDIVRASGAPAHLLKLELTESLVLENVQDAIAKMHRLRTQGVRFSMDDFGTGHSSLAYLTQLPLDQLKIDQSFVRNLGERPTDEVIVQTIIGMARTLDLEVIAEGVETLEQRDGLAQYGCHLYQGYLFGKPIPVAEFDALARGTAAAAVSAP